MDNQQNFIINEMRVFIKWSYSVIKSNTDSGVEIRAIVKAILEIIFK